MNASEPGAFASEKEELHIDTTSIRRAAFLVRAVNHPVRQAMLQVISREQEITVTALRRQFNMQQPIASSHLSVLRKTGVVTTRREGQRVLYSVRRDHLELLHQSIHKFFS